jgi:dolichol-phosphate mannosyltransferase
MKTTVVIPTYNEAANLPALVAELLALPLEDLRIVVVDDASPDGTGQVADELARQEPQRLQVLHRPAKLGLGTAYIAGFHLALDAGADTIVQMDADFSHAPADVLRLLEALATCDVAVGSRYVDGGRLDERWSWWRFLLSWWANSIYARLILGLKVRDATAGFKAWRRSALEAIDLDAIRSNGYVFQVEMAYVAQRLGLRVREIPIYFEDRRIGQSKMSIPIKLEAAWRVWDIRRRHRETAVARRLLVAETDPHT